MVPKSVWGRRGWNWLHTRAIQYPDAPSSADQAEALRDIQQFLAQLPCEECRFHALTHFRDEPPPLGDSWALQSWIWKFHNRVNHRLGKREIPFDKYLELYSDEINQRARPH